MNTHFAAHDTECAATAKRVEEMVRSSFFIAQSLPFRGGIDDWSKLLAIFPRSALSGAGKPFHVGTVQGIIYKRRYLLSNEFAEQKLFTSFPMQKNLTSECDSLRQALELAQKEVAKARKAQKEAEGRVASIEAQIRAQDAKLESMRRRIEKRKDEVRSPGIDKDERIKSLETLCEQKEEENRQLRTRLLESAAKRAASHRVRRRG